MAENPLGAGNRRGTLLDCVTWEGRRTHAGWPLSGSRISERRPFFRGNMRYNGAWKSMSAGAQPVRAKEGTTVAVHDLSPVYDEDILDWEAELQPAPPRPSGVVTVRLVRGKPASFVVGDSAEEPSLQE